MDLLVFRQVIGRRVRRAPKADGLDDFAGDNACPQRRLLIDDLAVD